MVTLRLKKPGLPVSLFAGYPLKKENI